MTSIPFKEEVKQQKTAAHIFEENEYQYQQRMGYDMAMQQIKPLLQDIMFDV